VTELETPRLLLREWRPEDREAFAVLNGDPEVMRYLGGVPLTRVASDALADRIAQHFEEHGFGLATFDVTTRAVRAAMEIVTAAKNMGLEVRAGVHVGEFEVRPDDVVGLPVSIAKRVCDLAGAGEVYVSEAVKVHLIGSGITTSEQGTHVLKGVPDEWRLFAVAG